MGGAAPYGLQLVEVERKQGQNGQLPLGGQGRIRTDCRPALLRGHIRMCFLPG